MVQFNSSAFNSVDQVEPWSARPTSGHLAGVCVHSVQAQQQGAIHLAFQRAQKQLEAVQSQVDQALRPVSHCHVPKAVSAPAMETRKRKRASPFACHDRDFSEQLSMPGTPTTVRDPRRHAFPYRHSSRPCAVPPFPHSSPALPAAALLQRRQTSLQP